MALWTLVHRRSNDPIVPFDCNPRSKDEGMLVYRSYQAACAACVHQRKLYEVDAIPMRLSRLELLQPWSFKQSDV